ncbi:hypothetical protein LINGRAHAP2_LOCUS32729, partial [Linum grandiflorum]
MSVMIEFKVRYGGKMVVNNGNLEYVGGIRDVVKLLKDKIGYFLLQRMALGNLGFTTLQ